MKARKKTRKAKQAAPKRTLFPLNLIKLDKLDELKSAGKKALRKVKKGFENALRRTA